MLLKSCDASEMMEGFTAVLDGGTYIAPRIAAILAETPTVVRLSEREREVLSMIPRGLQNQSIADCLSPSVRTVEKHRSSLMFELDVTSVAELMVYPSRGPAGGL